MRKWRVSLTVCERGVAAPEGAAIRGPGDVAAAFRRDVPEGFDREAFWVAALDAEHRILDSGIVSIGTLDFAPVSPREVFAPAVAARAKAIVVAHNHPSGDPTPSLDDRRVTARLREAGEILGITLLDHVVCGANGSYASAT